jgi:hypothetical protein
MSFTPREMFSSFSCFELGLLGPDHLVEHPLDHAVIHDLLVDRHGVALDLDVDRGAGE